MGFMPVDFLMVLCAARPYRSSWHPNAGSHGFRSANRCCHQAYLYHLQSLHTLFKQPWGHQARLTVFVTGTGCSQDDEVAVPLIRNDQTYRLHPQIFLFPADKVSRYFLAWNRIIRIWGICAELISLVPYYFCRSFASSSSVNPNWSASNVQ